MKVTGWFTVFLDPEDCWDFVTKRDGTIHVTEISVLKGADGSLQSLWFHGKRRLLKGGLSVQDPIGVLVSHLDIPNRLYRKMTKIQRRVL